MSGKSRHKNIQKDIKLETMPIKTIISIGILVISVVLMGVLMINLITNISKDKNTSDPWAEAYAKVEASKVGVEFNGVVTSEAQYVKLRLACKQYIEKVDINPDVKVAVDTVVSEETFIDKANNGINKSYEENKPMTETGPIYFQDMLLLRYINDTGELKVLTAAFENEKKDTIKIIKQSELKAHKDENTKEAKSQLDTGRIVETTNTKAITEENYLLDIGNTVIQMIKADTPEEVNKAEELAIRYFTVEGRKPIMDGKEIGKVTDDSAISLNYAIAGKSNIALVSKDRIYMQLKIISGGEEVLVNIIVKLNDNLKIFDIDVI